MMMLVLLLAQYLFDMVVNFWAVIPDNHSGAHPAEYFSGAATSVWWALGRGGWELTSHAGLGVILGLLGIALMVMAIRLRRRTWIIATIVGFLGILAAGFNGASFLNYNEDFSSMIMASAFVIALVSYASGLYVTKPGPAQAA